MHEHGPIDRNAQLGIETGIVHSKSVLCKNYCMIAEFVYSVCIIFEYSSYRIAMVQSMHVDQIRQLQDSSLQEHVRRAILMRSCVQLGMRARLERDIMIDMPQHICAP
jgi:hypothetical protein